MTDQNHIKASLTDEILDEMLTSLAKREEFDQIAVDGLRQLALSGDLKKAAQVIKVIKPS